MRFAGLVQGGVQIRDKARDWRQALGQATARV